MYFSPKQTNAPQGEGKGVVYHKQTNQQTSFEKLVTWNKDENDPCFNKENVEK